MNIGVVMGGTSSEREISLKSGASVAQALRLSGHHIFEIDFTCDNIDSFIRPEIDVYFIALHGGAGEDGRIQEQFEKRSIPFTGSGSKASHLAMDKYNSKRIMRESNIPVADDILLQHNDSLETFLNAAEHVGYPVVLKPCMEGSSIGVSIHHSASTLTQGITIASQLKGSILMEKYIIGREFTASVFKETALPLIELKPNRAFFDFQAKYEDKDTDYIVTPDLPSDITRSIQDIALTTHKLIGCRTFSRTDIILATDQTFIVLEINTIPGLTERSLFPKAALASGISFATLCMNIVDDACSHHAS